jgi:hypothetical protein
MIRRCAALFIVWSTGCLVYDDSLLSSSPKATGGRSGVGGSGGSFIGAGGSPASGGTDGNGVGGGASSDDAGSNVGQGGIAGSGVGEDAASGFGGSTGVADGSMEGAGGVGGSSGSGGAAGSKSDAGPLGNETLIDNMEHAGDSFTAPNFSGHWYLFNDGTAGGVETPSPFTMTSIDVANPGLPSSKQAAHAAGSGFNTFGCGLGFGITQAAAGIFDARGYTGITFWARAGVGAATHVTMALFDPRAEAASGCTRCGDLPITSFDVTTSWQKFHLPFSLFRQGGWGSPQFGLYDPKAFEGGQFYVGAGSKLDLWIDDVALYAQ